MTTPAATFQLCWDAIIDTIQSDPTEVVVLLQLFFLLEIFFYKKFNFRRKDTTIYVLGMCLWQRRKTSPFFSSSIAHKMCTNISIQMRKSDDDDDDIGCVKLFACEVIQFMHSQQIDI